MSRREIFSLILLQLLGGIFSFFSIWTSAKSWTQKGRVQLWQRGAFLQNAPKNLAKSQILK